MELSHKSFEVKAAPEEGEGVFKGYASTWERDLYDDVIVKGAYEECLKSDFNGTGEGIPIYWNHDYSTPMNLIGASVSAVEDEKGLAFVGKLDIDSPEGKRAYEHLKAGRVHQMSIGFIAQESAWVREEDAKSPFDGHRELRKIKLFEVSLVTVAANQGAEVDEVKALIAEMKAGRAISAANEEKIRAAYDALGELLDSISDGQGSGDDEGGDSGQGDSTEDGNDTEGEKSAIRASRAAEIRKIAEYIGGADTSTRED